MPIELFRGVARQARVGIERDAIAHRREDVQLADLHAEARVGRASQQPVELLDLAAFALPPHPRVFLRIPAPRTMKQKEAIRMSRAEPPIEALDARRARRQESADRRAARGESASAKSLRIAKWMCGSRLPSASTSTCSSSAATDAGARQHRRHDDHRAGVVRNAIGEVEAGQATRRDRPGDQRVARARSRCRPPGSAGAAPARP